MWSVPRRRRLSSTARMIHRREFPRWFSPGPIGLWNFVASTTSSRIDPFSARPTISSERPSEYMSAVSTKLMPPSIARWTMRTQSSASSLPHGPNIIVPRQCVLTRTPVVPSVRYSMLQNLPCSHHGSYHSPCVIADTVAAARASSSRAGRRCIDAEKLTGPRALQSFALVICTQEVCVPDRNSGHTKTLGWIGVGRMGAALVERLIRAGCDVSVYNRTRVEGGAARGAGRELVDTPADLSDRDIVITMVSSSDDLLAVIAGDDGVLSRAGRDPRLARGLLHRVGRGSRRGPAPGGGRRIADAGGTRQREPEGGASRETQHRCVGSRRWIRPRAAVPGDPGPVRHLRGEGEVARLVKICHNLLLGIVAAALSEITVLAERGGVSRSDLLSFINDSVMGSVFTRYKTPAFVEPRFHADVHRSSAVEGPRARSRRRGAARGPLPVTTTVQGLLRDLIEDGVRRSGLRVADPARSAGSGMTLEPELVEVDDGLSPLDELARQASRGER